MASELVSKNSGETCKLEEKYINFCKLQTQKSQLIQLASLHLNEIIRRLAMTYSHMGRPHTTIGAFA
ncbi:hypothetical protein ACRN97_21105, partial [Shewanella baltica]|uniref:hypothetical protein n=1 Tax=Shewanella baltica TaxID=62322 RepID=UPI003D7B3358